MKRLLLLISVTASLAATSAWGQLPFEKLQREQPDLEKIQHEITDRSSKYYYPALMKEYLSNDTAMTMDKYRYLYLGFMFQEDYDPYRPSPAPDMNSPLYHSTNPTGNQCEQIIRNARIALDNNPFDLRQMSAMITAMDILGQKDLSKIWQHKLNHILMTIVSTGTGEDEEHAWYVIELQHEYVLLNMMGYQVTNHLFYDPSYEYLTVVDVSSGKKGGFYFNLEPLLQEHYRKFPDEL